MRREVLFWRIVDRLYFVLAGAGFPSAAGLQAGGWHFAGTLTVYLCGVALCALGGRALRRAGGKEMAASILCLLLPMALLAFLGQRSPVDCLVNFFLALLGVFIGYKVKR